MNFKASFFTFSIFFIIACSSNPNNDIYKTKAGEYISKTGRFSIKFPKKPKFNVTDKKIGEDKFVIYSYKTTIDNDKIFSLEYVDFPEHIIKSRTDDALYTQVISNMVSNMPADFELKLIFDTEQDSLKAKYFAFEKNEENRDEDPYAEGMVLRKNNRIYTIMYLGAFDEKVNEFIKKFHILE